MSEMGPKETAVRATLAGRPAAVINDFDDDLGRKVNHCFAGLFNGALSSGHLSPNGSLFLGKAECEWDWEEVWPEMAKRGLVTFYLADQPAPGSITGKTTKFRWSLTDKGHDVREDDNRYFKELMDAMRADRAAEDAAS